MKCQRTSVAHFDIFVFAVDALDDPPGGTAALFSFIAGRCESGEKEHEGDNSHLVGV